jgi:hypothetical protein
LERVPHTSPSESQKAAEQKWLNYIQDLPAFSFTPALQALLHYFLDIYKQKHEPLGAPPVALRNSVNNLKSSLRKDIILGAKAAELDEVKGLFLKVLAELQRGFGDAEPSRS